MAFRLAQVGGMSAAGGRAEVIDRAGALRKVGVEAAAVLFRLAVDLSREIEEGMRPLAGDLLHRIR